MNHPFAAQAQCRVYGSTASSSHARELAECRAELDALRAAAARTPPATPPRPAGAGDAAALRAAEAELDGARRECARLTRALERAARPSPPPSPPPPPPGGDAARLAEALRVADARVALAETERDEYEATIRALRDRVARANAAANAADADARSAKARAGAGQESERPNFKASYLGRLPLVSADLWTSDHLSERPRSVDAFFPERARAEHSR